jgi:polysaccharide biosynthesis transport protein
MKKLFLLLGRHWRALLGINALIISAVVAFKLSSYEENWQATAKLVIPESTSQLDANLGELGSLRTDNPSFSQQVNPLKLQISILTSDVVMEKALAQDPEKKLFEDVAEYKELFKIAPEEQTTTIQLYTVGSNPELALQRITRLLAIFEARLDELRVSENDARESFGQEKLTQAKTDLDKAKQLLVNFQKDSGWVDADVQSAELIKLINTLQEQATQANANAQASANQAATLSNRIGLPPAQAVNALGLDANADYQLIRQQLTQTSVDLAQAQADFTDAHPQVQLLLRRQESLNAELRQFITSVNLPAGVNSTVTSGAEGRTELIQQMLLADAQASSQQLQSNQLAAEVNALNQQLNLVPAAKAELVDLQRQYDLAEGVYRGLLTQTQQSNISAFAAYPNVQTLDPPRVESQPIAPDIKLVVANALLAAIAASAALLLVLEGRDPLVIPADLRETKFNFVSRIPWLNFFEIDQLLLNREIDLPIDFQWLGAMVGAQLDTGNYLLVTSASGGEGKTTVTIGLAKALCDQGFRVLAVDASAKSDLCNLFGYEGEAAKPKRLLSIRPDLDLIMFNSLYRNQLQQYLNAIQAEQAYDYIIIDAPAISERVDSLLINQFVENVLFVVKPKTSRQQLVRKSLKQLNRRNSGFIGLVVNGNTATADEYKLIGQPESISV